MPMVWHLMPMLSMHTGGPRHVRRWSTQRKPKVSDSSMQGAGGYVFWWWQYLWLSFVAMAPHVLEMWQQIFPVGAPGVRGTRRGN